MAVLVLVLAVLVLPSEVEKHSQHSCCQSLNNNIQQYWPPR